MKARVMQEETLRDKEIKLILEVLEKTHWDVEKSSRLLKIPVSQLKRKISEYKISKPD